MKIRYLGILAVLVLLVGCAAKETPTTPAAPAAPEAPVAPVEEPAAVPEAEEPAAANEATGGAVKETKSSDKISIAVTADGFKDEEIKIAKGSSITIVNEDRIMHKLNGGDLFKEQLNTYLRSVYGSEDPLGRNTLEFTVNEAGTYEIKDVTRNDAIKIIAE